MIRMQLFNFDRPLVVCLLLLLLLSGGLLLFVLNGIVNMQETPLPAPSRQNEAIVLLAGKREERAPKAISLYQAGHAVPILVTNDGRRSRWSKKHQRNLNNSEWTEEMLVQAGIPASFIIKLPFTASGTVHDARAVREYLLDHPVNRLLLVTSNFHARRSLWIFKRALRDMPVHIDVVTVASERLSPRLIVLEVIKTVYYWLRYGLLEKP
jgi:uncharacterized SAM-binding protein YcdF (DUF218 family)